MKLGKDAVAYHGAAGADPSDQLSKVKEISWNIDTDVAESKTRDSRWKNKAAAHGEGSVDITFEWDGGADQQAIQTAHLAGTARAFKFLDAAGGRGIRGDFIITSYERSEPSDEGIELSISLELDGAPIEVNPA